MMKSMYIHAALFNIQMYKNNIQGPIHDNNILYNPPLLNNDNKIHILCANTKINFMHIDLVLSHYRIFPNSVSVVFLT